MGINIAWGDGHLEVKAIDNELLVKAGNLKIMLRPRVIIVEGVQTEHEVGEAGKRSKKKYVYIYPDQGIRSLEGRGKIINEYNMDRFEIKYQRLSFNEYLTIITPGEYLYDYIIITRDTITIAMSGKREPYFYKENNRLTIYLV